MKSAADMGKVSVSRAQAYSKEPIEKAVRGVLAPFGGASSICPERGKRVLLKPNVLRPAAPEEAVTTHPEVIKAVAREFMAAGAEVYVGDGPGGDPGPAGPAFEKSGIAGACREMGIPLLNFQEEGSQTVSLSNAPVPSVNIAKPVFEADIIVNLCKFKTHSLTQFTCALKNLYGYIPGVQKGKLHTAAAKVEDFSKLPCALWEVIPAAFTIVDAVVGMEGQGPSGGEPREIGWILGGVDPLAIDTVCTWAMGFDVKDLPLLNEARLRNLGVGDLDRIQIINGELSELKIPGFELPRVRVLPRILPRTIVQPLARITGKMFWVRPRIIPERCELCYRCVRSCPAGALHAEPDEPPELKYPKRCISCLCCQEICPAKAIEVRKSFIVTRIFNAEKKQAEKELQNEAGSGPSSTGPHGEA